MQHLRARPLFSLKYNEDKGNFGWNLVLDNGKEIFISNVGEDFLLDLQKKIEDAILIKNEYGGKKNKISSSIPSKLLEVKK